MKNKDSSELSHANYQIDISTMNKCIYILINNEVIANSTHALQVCEQGHEPVYYFPREDVRLERLHKIDKVTFCPYKGEAIHWAITTNDKQLKTAAWSYENPFEQVSAIKNHIAFYPDVLDHIIIE